MSATTSAPEATPVAEVDNSLGAAFRDYTARVRGGELGALPAVLGLVSLVIIFTALKGSVFFSTFNFANLITQSSTYIVLAMGLVFVLLLGEIDLSAGFAAGTAGAGLRARGLLAMGCLLLLQWSPRHRRRIANLRNPTRSGSARTLALCVHLWN